MPAAATRPIEPAMFDFQVNNGAYVEITAFNQSARDMIGGRGYIEELPNHPTIVALLDSDASFMDMDGDTLTGDDLKNHLGELSFVANDL